MKEPAKRATEVLMSQLSPTSAGSNYFPMKCSWGSAVLHPRLYADHALRAFLKVVIRISEAPFQFIEHAPVPRGSPHEPHGAIGKSFRENPDT